MELSCIPVSLFPKLTSGQLSIAQWAGLACELGLDAIDISILFLASRSRSYLREIAGAVRKSGLRLAIVNTYPDLTHPDAGERKKQITALLSDIDTAAELGAGIVRITAGQAHPSLDAEEAKRWVIDGFHEAACHADKRGIRLAYENHSKPGAWRYWDFSYPSDIFLSIAERIRDTPIGILFDTANASVGGEDPLLLLDKVIQRVICVHAADTGTKGQLSPVVVGTGIVPFGRVFGFLRRKGFNGVISIEEASQQGVAGLQEAIHFVKTTWYAKQPAVN
jgi:sugar phosphate isomerase/epimerase